MIAAGVCRVSFRTVSATLALSFGLAATCAAQRPAEVIPANVPPPPVYVNPRAGADDPRIGLKAGYLNAADAKFGLELLTSIPKPAVFDPPPPPTPGAQGRMAGNGLTYANSDLAFHGNHAFMGNFYGVTFYDITSPAKAALITTLVCPGGQGDVSVYGNLLFMSVEGGGRMDCGTGPVTLPKDYVVPPPPTPGQPRGAFGPGPASPDRVRGIRIFDISDIKNPKQVAAVQTCRGSHTHTLLVDPKDPNDVYIYVAGSANVRPDAELAGCSGGGPENPNTALFTIVVIKVPLAHPELAKVVSSPRIFADPANGKMDGLKSADNVHGMDAPGRETSGCHDITVFSPMGLAAGACSGNGIVLDIKDPVNPKRLYAVSDPNFSFWHSANFSNDGSKLIFTDEWGGGTAPRCRATDPMHWGADTIFDLHKDGSLKLESYFKMPAAQTDLENCVAHNGSIIPVPGRDIMAQAWYQGGVSIFDFTDASHPVEIAYFDRGPVDPTKMVIGGEWSVYWYNGFLYGSEIARGLDVFKLLPSKYLTQNEIDAANQIHFAELNVQNQPQVKWPSNMIVAKAYIDQLARGKSVSADKLTALIAAIDKKDSKVLKAMAVSLDKDAASAATPKDAERMKALAAIIK